MNLVSQERISGRVRSCTVGRCEGLGMRQAIRLERSSNKPSSGTHLWWYIVVEVAGILRATEVWPVRGRVPVYVLPINATEPWMSLYAVSNDARLAPTQTHLDQVGAVHATHGALRRDETAASRLHDHGVGPANGCRCLRPKTVFRLAEELLHQIDCFVRDPWPRREAERLFPVQDLLPSDMALYHRRS